VIILQAGGTHFDPDVIEAFKQLTDGEIERIKLEIG
jgi:response regulator RpfG family c-di-GMP phosphodiesterase